MRAAAVAPAGTMDAANAVSTKLKPATVDQFTSSTDGSSRAVRVNTLDNFWDTLTLSAGVTTSCLRGYVGRWKMYAPPADADSSDTTHTTPDSDNSDLKIVEEAVNFRMWQIVDPEVPSVRQVNLLQIPIGAASGFAPYLQSDKRTGREDNYIVRQWTYKPTGKLWETDASSWLGGENPAVTAERTCVALGVRDCSVGVFYGALPSGKFRSNVDGKEEPWWLECIMKAKDSHAHRWFVVTSYGSDLALGPTRANREDLLEMTEEEVQAKHIDPSAMNFEPARERLPADIDGWLQQQHTPFPLVGSGTTFCYDADHQLTAATHTATWSSSHVTADNMAVQTFPDGFYIRMPKSVPPPGTAAEPGAVLTFEAGAVQGDGCLSRWLVVYDLNTRLLRTATYERYTLGE